MGAVFASAARAPLTSLASVVEMTGDFALTLAVMLAVAIASMTSRALSYGTIYITKLLRRGTDIDRATPGGPWPTSRSPTPCAPSACRSRSPPPTAAARHRTGPHCPGPAIYQADTQTLFATESITQALRQSEIPIGRDHHHRRLARRRTQARRRHLAAGQHPRDRPARPSAPPAAPGAHPGPRRPHLACSPRRPAGYPNATPTANTMPSPPTGETSHRERRDVRRTVRKNLFRTDRGSRGLPGNARASRRLRPDGRTDGPGAAGSATPSRRRKPRPHRLGGFLDGHPPGLDRFTGGPAQREAGGQQPGGQGGVDVAAVLAALDELEHPLEDRASARARQPALRSWARAARGRILG